MLLSFDNYAGKRGRISDQTRKIGTTSVLEKLYCFRGSQCWTKVQQLVKKCSFKGFFNMYNS